VLWARQHDDPAALAQALRVVAPMRRAREPWARAMEAVVRGAVAGLRGERTVALAAYDEADGLFAAAEMRAYLAAVRWRAAQLDETRAAAAAEGLAFMREQGMPRPESFLAVLAA
jgi:hypothetical protein